MLLNFSCDNFKAFQDGFSFNMVPTDCTELKYSILKEKIGSKPVSALSASVIYGPNAAGKTSIIQAMSCMRQIVLRGHIKDADTDRVQDHVSSSMEIAPFAFSEEPRPVSFDVTFTFHGVLYRYCISAYLGSFMQEDAQRYISREQLYIGGKLVFDRSKDAVELLELKPAKALLNVGYTVTDAGKTIIAMSSNMEPERLLLLSDFSSFCSKKIAGEIRDWFEMEFMVVNSSDRARFLPFAKDEITTARIYPIINDIAKEAGIIGSDFAYVRDPDSDIPKLVSVLRKDEKNESMAGIDADRIESVGTLRLVAIMPAVISALKKGAVLVMDEMDASLHPMIVMNLISIFHNDEVNKNRAQLIFNTHNPIYLNHDLLRRDEIKFVERDKGTKSSSLYALSDFKTNGKACVRKTSDYMKNYFVDRYGAIEDIDFTDIIADILKEGSGDE